MQASPLSMTGTWDLVADHYDREIVPVFEMFAREALALAGVRAGARVVDVAAGPGTLALLAAAAGAEVQALDFAPRMVELLLGHVAERGLGGRVVAQVGDGMALPYADSQFDAGFSMFGLMFFSDRAKGLGELFRVLVPGARVVIASWRPMLDVPLLSGAAAELAALTNPDAPPAPVPPAFPLSTPALCEQELTAAGFDRVQVHERAARSEFESMSAMIASFARSSAPFALAKRTLGEGWDAVERTLVERLIARFGDGPQSIEMPAYLTVGRRP